MNTTQRMEMDLVLPENFETDDVPQILDRARDLLELPPDAKLHVENMTKTARGTRIDFSVTHSIMLDDEALDDVMGLRVDVNSHGALKFNARGGLVSHQVTPAD